MGNETFSFENSLLSPARPTVDWMEFLTLDQNEVLLWLVEQKQGPRIPAGPNFLAVCRIYRLKQPTYLTAIWNVSLETVSEPEVAVTLKVRPRFRALAFSVKLPSELFAKTVQPASSLP